MTEELVFFDGTVDPYTVEVVNKFSGCSKENPLVEIVEINPETGNATIAFRGERAR